MTETLANRIGELPEVGLVKYAGEEVWATVVIGAGDVAPSWQFLVEVSTRIVAVELPHTAGTEQGALDSIYTIFGTYRSLTREFGLHGQAFTVAATTYTNQILRPFTAAWHARSEFFHDPAVRGDFRHHLIELRQQSYGFVLLFASLASVDGAVLGITARSEGSDD